MELDGDHLLIGIGINVVYAPEVIETGENAGRSSTCIKNYTQLPSVESSTAAEVLVSGDGSSGQLLPTFTKEIAVGITER
jgi:hypothetical protein